MKKIPNFKGYWATKNGRVFSGYKQISAGGSGNGFRTIIHNKPIKELKPALRKGYLFVVLRKNNKPFNVNIHKIVLETFIGERPQGKVCRHLDGNPLNNRLENLCWGTPAENSADMVRMGRQCGGEKHHKTKLTDNQVLELLEKTKYIKDGRQHKGIIKNLCQEYGIVQPTLNAYRKGKIRKYLTIK